MSPPTAPSIVRQASTSRSRASSSSSKAPGPSRESHKQLESITTRLDDLLHSLEDLDDRSESSTARTSASSQSFEKAHLSPSEAQQTLAQVQAAQFTLSAKMSKVSSITDEGTQCLFVLGQDGSVYQFDADASQDSHPLSLLLTTSCNAYIDDVESIFVLKLHSDSSFPSRHWNLKSDEETVTLWHRSLSQSLSGLMSRSPSSPGITSTKVFSRVNSISSSKTVVNEERVAQQQARYQEYMLLQQANAEKFKIKRAAMDQELAQIEKAAEARRIEKERAMKAKAEMMMDAFMF
ncbi:hypothetical protein HDU98_011562 [Podochytrium sp. JEL0797]|nr:hypothetical protein HDU98_011562 [Podochytrium sp. JEL0797]